MKLSQLFRQEKAIFFVAFIMIIFGLAEIVTGFRHEFFGLVTAENTITTVIGAGLGFCYLIGGILLLFFNKRALFTSFLLLVIDIIGRLVMVFSGMYPMDTAMQIIGIVGGTVISAAFAIFVLVKCLKMTKRANNNIKINYRKILR